MAAYTSTKAAVDMMVRAAAWELGVFGIRVNAIQPGYVPTEGTEGAFTDELSARSARTQRPQAQRNPRRHRGARRAPRTAGRRVDHGPGDRRRRGNGRATDGRSQRSLPSDLRRRRGRRRARPRRELIGVNSVIDVDRVIEELTAETGLDDFGDPTYRDGLDVLVAALTDEARLSDVGHAVAVGQITSMLKTRLLVEQWWSDHPELDEERIEAPIFIVGLSRSGTTALSHLLARDPRNRSLLGVGGVVTGSSTAPEHLCHRRTLRGRASRRVRASPPAQSRDLRRCTTTRPTCRSSASSRWRSTSWRSASL